MKIYSIYDRAAHMYGNLLIQNNDDLCKRNLKTALAQEALGKEITTYPEDFELYCLGDFENDEGLIAPGKSFVCRISDLLPQKEEKKDA